MLLFVSSCSFISTFLNRENASNAARAILAHRADAIAKKEKAAAKAAQAAMAVSQSGIPMAPPRAPAPPSNGSPLHIAVPAPQRKLEACV